MIVNNKLSRSILEANAKGERLVAPLMGMPGLNMVGSNVKLAQQNYDQHFQTIRALADEFAPDCIFPLMDLSVEANALGRYTVFPREEAATVVTEPFNDVEIEQLRGINIACDGRVNGYLKTVDLMSRHLASEMLIGAYVSGPYSLAALIMGAQEAAMATVLEKDKLYTLCDFCTGVIEGYTRLLISAGAEAVCVLEPTAVMLNPNYFKTFSADYVSRIADLCRTKDVASIYHTCGNTMHVVGLMGESGVDALSLDSPEVGVDLPAAAREVPEGVAIIGNLNPTGKILKGSPEEVELGVNELLETMEGIDNFVLSTGCDLPQNTPLENIDAFMKAGRSGGAGNCRAGALPRQGVAGNGR